MFHPMATVTQRCAVRNIVSQCREGRKRFDVMRMQVDCLPIPRMRAAFLAGVIISFKYLFAPVNVFGAQAGKVVLMRLRRMGRALGLIGLYRCNRSLLMGFAMGNTGARACATKPTLSFVFWHGLLADRARRNEGHAQTANTQFIAGNVSGKPMAANETSRSGLCVNTWHEHTLSHIATLINRRLTLLGLEAKRL